MDLIVSVAAGRVETVLSGFAELEVLGSDLVKQRVGENVLVLLKVFADGAAELVKLVGDIVGGTVGDGLGLTVR